jgi:hypothetical protein
MTFELQIWTGTNRVRPEDVVKRGATTGLYPVMSKLQLAAVTASLSISTLAFAQPIQLPGKECVIELPSPDDPGSCTSGWHALGFPLSTKAAYLNTFPEDCYWDAGGLLQCYFATAKEACDGLIVMNNDIEKNGTKYVFKRLETAANDPDWVHCISESVNGDGTLSGFEHDVSIEYTSRPERGDFVQNPNSSGNAVLLDVSGPYRLQPDTPYNHVSTPHTGQPFPGSKYGCLNKATQNGTFDFRTIILGLNAFRFRGDLVSDLANYPYPKPKSSECIKKHPRMAGWCIESDDPLQAAAGFPNSAQVHHEIPRKFNVSGKSCPWGRASMKNALVISAQLNNYFSNKYPEVSAVQRMNNTPSYVPFP